VAQESAAAEARVKEASQAQIAGEAKKLQDQVSTEIAELRRKAAEQVATEAKRLETLTAEQVKALQAATQQQLDIADLSGREIPRWPLLGMCLEVRGAEARDHREGRDFVENADQQS
jgi:L-lactate utilization protein LutC